MVSCYLIVLDHNPSIIYVYDIFKAMLDSVIYLNHDVISLQWSPLDPESFAFITSNRQFLYLWSKKGPKSMQIPSGIVIAYIR
jgi:WD40 repeat protein